MKRYMVHILFLSAAMLFFYSEIYAATTQTYQYDANGNLIQGEGKYYEYNEANQLTKVRHGDQSDPVIAEYVYDYSGQRIKKIENGVTTYYIGKHFERQVAGTASTNTSYYFANAKRVVKKDPSGDLFYYHADHLGGTNVVTDASGNMVEQIKYYPFGEIREGGIEKYSYTGKEKDKLTDWYYYEARYYNTNFMHFAQADSLMSDPYDPQEFNRYAYVRNNPIKYIDPDGYEKKSHIIVVHGTYVSSSYSDYTANSDFMNAVTRSYALDTDAGDTIESFSWSGKNRDSARKSAAVDLSNRIKNIINADTNEGNDSEIIVIGHSHGGNVAQIASRDVNINKLITLDTPQEERYRPDHINIGKHYNLYGTNIMRGTTEFLGLFSKGESSRNINGPENISVKKNDSGWAGHSDFHSASLWNDIMAPIESDYCGMGIFSRK